VVFDARLKHTRKQGIHRHQTPPRYRNAATGSRFTVQPPRFTIRPTTAKRDVIHKTRSTQRIATPPEEDRATTTEICSRTDIHTDRQTNWSQYSASLPGRVKNQIRMHYQSNASCLLLLSVKPTQQIT